MLVSLHISNYALIDTLDVEFPRGLSIITGETGAGKSIILGAIDLLRGRRADTNALRDKSIKAISEAVFDISDNDGALRWLTSQDYDCPADGLLTLRREISPSGRSRAFINDSPATLQSMQELTLMLLDIHSQHQTQQLANPRTRLAIIDSLATDKTPLLSYHKAFEAYNSTRKRLLELRRDMEQTQQKRSQLTEQYEYLSAIDPKPGEQKELETLYDLQSRASQLKEQMGMVRVNLDGYERSARSQVEQSLSLLRRMHIASLAQSSNDAPSVIERLQSILVELKDISAELEDLDAGIDEDPLQLARTEKRLDTLYQAQITFKTNNPDELPQILQSIKKQLEDTDDPAHLMPSLQLELKQRAAELKEAASNLTAQRQTNALEFSERLQAAARTLGLPNLRFEARLSQVKMWSQGADLVEFLCAFNKNQQLMPLEATASGGESSRLMLAMKAIIAGKLQLPTIIFDEIDTGISGEIASMAGEMMHRISAKLQVITITHLPQVAACGDSHFKVYKQDNEQETLTRILRLTHEDRRVEIAKMLSGSVVDEAALRNADSLLKNKPVKSKYIHG